jgi:hypothetical protein
MKSLKTFLAGLSALVAVSASAAEGLVTLAVQGGPATNEVQIAANQQGTVKSYLDEQYLLNPNGEGYTRLRIMKEGKQIDIHQRNFDNMKLLSVAGPATRDKRCKEIFQKLHVRIKASPFTTDSPDLCPPSA